MDLYALVTQASAILDAATEPFLAGHRAESAVPKKGDDFATEVDLAIERQIAAALVEATGIGVHGEEFGGPPVDSPWVWVLDPIDGTFNYAAGSPMASILLALLHDGEPVAGLTWLPFTGDRYTAVAGGPTPLDDPLVIVTTQMNRVLDVNEALAYALVEPGVGYYDLYAHLRARGSTLWVDPPAAGWGSLTGNALERGFRHSRDASLDTDSRISRADDERLDAAQAKAVQRLLDARQAQSPHGDVDGSFGRSRQRGALAESGQRCAPLATRLDDDGPDDACDQRRRAWRRGRRWTPSHSRRAARTGTEEEKGKERQHEHAALHDRHWQPYCHVVAIRSSRVHRGLVIDRVASIAAASSGIDLAVDCVTCVSSLSLRTP